MSEVKTNKISSLDSSNSDITLDPDGTGDVVVAAGHKLGAGTASPSSALHVYDGSDAKINMETSTNTAFIGNISGSMEMQSADIIKFLTSGANERMRITTGGDVGIGTSSPTVSNGKGLVIADATAARLKLCDTTTGEGASDGVQLGHSGGIGFLFNHENEALQFGTNNTERMRILSTGEICMNETARTLVCVQHISFDGASEQGLVIKNNDNSTNGAAVRFVDYTGASSGGGIYFQGSNSINYATSSDARLKENVADMTGAIDRVKSLAPKRFNYITDADTTVDGFLAHEAQTVVPEAVIGTENGVDENGNPQYQAIDASRLVPLLTGALQEAIAKIEALEARVTALENA